MVSDIGRQHRGRGQMKVMKTLINNNLKTGGLHLKYKQWENENKVIFPTVQTFNMQISDVLNKKKGGKVLVCFPIS